MNGKKCVRRRKKKYEMSTNWNTKEEWQSTGWGNCVTRDERARDEKDDRKREQK